LAPCSIAGRAYYDWKDRILKEFQIDNRSYGKINKIIFDYDLSGKLKEKMV